VDTQAAVDNQVGWYNPGYKVVVGAGTVDNQGDIEDPYSIAAVSTVQDPWTLIQTRISLKS
jgi:hypothetical protein